MKTKAIIGLTILVASCSSSSPAIARTMSFDIGPTAVSLISWAAAIVGTVAIVVAILAWVGWRRHERRVAAMRADFDAEWSRHMEGVRGPQPNRFRIDGLTVAGLGKVIEDLVDVRPTNWEDSRDPQQRAAWRAADAVLAKLGRR